MNFKEYLRFLTILSVVCFAGFYFMGSDAYSQAEDQTEKIYKQQMLIQEGSALVKLLRFDDAIKKFRAAGDPELLLHDYSDDPPFFFIAKVLKLQSKYEQAIHVLVPVIDKYPIKESNWTDEKLSLEALVQYGNTKNPKAIYDHILYLRKKYKKLLPPRKMAAGTPEMVAATIFRLYEHIGDFDGGVKFAEEFLKYYKKLGPGNPYQLGNPYFRVIQEFQIDKQEGFKGCADAKSGDTCMGHVTRYIIQSDFFPW